MCVWPAYHDLDMQLVVHLPNLVCQNPEGGGGVSPATLPAIWLRHHPQLLLRASQFVQYAPGWLAAQYCTTDTLLIVCLDSMAEVMQLAVHVIVYCPADRYSAQGSIVCAAAVYLSLTRHNLRKIYIATA